MPQQIEVLWNLRTTAVADDGREFENLINGAQELYKEKGWRLITMTKNGPDARLNRRQCRELWEWLGRIDKVPRRLRIFFNSEDMKRIWPRNKG